MSPSVYNDQLFENGRNLKVTRKSDRRKTLKFLKVAEEAGCPLYTAFKFQELGVHFIDVRFILGAPDIIILMNWNSSC